MADFSEAQRNGFLDAFIRFRRDKFGDARTDEELKDLGRTLYKGCARHFGDSVNRVCKLMEVREHETAFRKLVDVMIHAENPDDFNAAANRIEADFPMVYRWLDWWRRPANAAMIFRSMRLMDDRLWNAIPDTTNAEESMHWCLYSAVGFGHDALSGILGLVMFVEDFRHMYNDFSRELRFHILHLCIPNSVHISLDGRKIDYGESGRWNKYFETLGTTHPSRSATLRGKANKLTNDGRPPDTVKKLFGRNALKTRQKKKVRLTSRSTSRTSTTRSPSGTRSPSKPRSPASTQGSTKVQSNSKPQSPSKAQSPSKPLPTKLQSMSNPPSASKSHVTPKSPLKSIPFGELSGSYVDLTGTEPEEAVNVASHLANSVRRTLIPSQVTAKATTVQEVSYPFDHNSCWLDTTLEVTFRCLTRNVDDFRQAMASCQPISNVHVVIEHVLQRMVNFGLSGDKLNVGNIRKELTKGRDWVRQESCRLGTSRPGRDYDALWVRTLHPKSVTSC